MMENYLLNANFLSPCRPLTPINRIEKTLNSPNVSAIQKRPSSTSRVQSYSSFNRSQLNSSRNGVNKSQQCHRQSPQTKSDTTQKHHRGFRRNIQGDPNNVLSPNPTPNLCHRFKKEDVEEDEWSKRLNHLKQNRMDSINFGSPLSTCHNSIGKDTSKITPASSGKPTLFHEKEYFVELNVDPPSPQPITPYNIGNKSILHELTTPTPFRNQFSGPDIEKFKNLIQSAETPSSDSPFLELDESKPANANETPSPKQSPKLANIPQNFSRSPTITPPKLKFQERKLKPSSPLVTSKPKNSSQIIAPKHQPNIQIESPALVDISNLKSLASQYLHSGLIEEALEKAKECQEAIFKTVGSNHKDNIYINILIGEANTHLGKFDQAKNALTEGRRLIERFSNSNGELEDRELVLFSIQIFNDLGYLWKLQGKYKSSIEMYSKHLVLRLKYYDTNTNEVASAYNLLGVVYTHLGTFDKAMECLNRALEIREVILGTSHVETATVYNNIGNIYMYIGDFFKALQHYRVGKEIIENNNMTAHPDFATSLANMATCLKRLCQYEESILMYEKALTLRQHIFGEYHNSTISCYLMIGMLYLEMNNMVKALEYVSHATKVRELDRGESHIDTASCYLSLGCIRQVSGEQDAALHLFEKVKEIYCNHYGENHPETIGMDEHISTIYLATGGVEALEMLVRVAAFKQKFHGDLHPCTATVYNNIGNVLRQQGRNDESFHMYIKAKNIYEGVYGFDHYSNSVVHTNIGHLYYASFQHNTNDVELIRAIVSLPANTSIQEGKISTALKYYTQAKSIRERLLGVEHIETIVSNRNLALVHAAMKKYDIAYQLISQCRNLQTLLHPTNEREMKETSRVMADILRESNGRVRRGSGLITTLNTSKVNVNKSNPSLSQLLDTVSIDSASTFQDNKLNGVSSIHYFNQSDHTHRSVRLSSAYQSVLRKSKQNSHFK